jgi:alpha-N-acetylglucosaminidase
MPVLAPAVAPNLVMRDAALGVLQRTVGPAASRFTFETLPPRADGLDAFSVEADSGTVHLRGTTAVAMCRGAYEYLKDACHIQVSWNGGPVRLPKVLPDYARREVVGPNQWRHYFNICTFGYTTVWWDWKRWQKEIDWMALHGINMPLAMTGQEKVWQTTFRGLGIPDSSIAKFFSGPAFLPWHWMGNLNGHMGPLPQSWIDGQAALQTKILNRERSLGMKPVVPGFSGFVPTDFAKFHPEVALSSPTAWCNFEPTTFVDVRNPMFVEIGRRFVENYRRQFGSDHFYLCDTFNEQLPQFAEATELEDLAASGRSVVTALRSADPQAVWIMQGWLFYNAADYWTIPRVEALLRDVPENGMIVLDLATNESAVWKRLPPVRRMGWIYNTLHNYGQTTGLYGNLQRLVNRSHEDLNDPTHGKMLGMGLTPEGIEQNPVVYELMTDAMWTDGPIDVNRWIETYVHSRYGVVSPDALKAWRGILTTIYGQDLSWYRASWRLRPAERTDKPPYDAKALQTVIESLLHCPELRGNPLYERDLVDVTKTWLGVLADLRLAGASLCRDIAPKEAKQERATFFQLLDALDQIMACRKEHRMSTWIAAARKWGKTSSERDLMEANARTQVTVWGRDQLFDYANKEWAGLNQDFIQGRWHAYFDNQDQHQNVDLAAWELAWTNRTGRIKESKPADPFQLAGELLKRFANESTEIRMPAGLDDDPGIAVGKPVRVSGGTEPGHDPQNAVDGHILGGYWAASPAPQWLEVDLQATKKVKGITLVPYFGDARSYQYRIEVSTDGTNYRTVAEAEGPATMTGYKHKFDPIEARFVRVTMLHNSANVGVHIQELRVFGD